MAGVTRKVKLKKTGALRCLWSYLALPLLALLRLLLPLQVDHTRLRWGDEIIEVRYSDCPRPLLAHAAF